MAGLYPDDEKISVFGEEIFWPGLDPVSGKFTNGDFSNPLIKPSFIPAQTINLIIDNLNNFILGLGLTPNNTDQNQLLKALQEKYATTEWLMDFLFPLGCKYKQTMNDPPPLERNFPGSWEIWNARADGYELIAGALPSYAIYTPGANYAFGTYVLYHLSGDDWEIFRALEAITNASQYLDSVKWAKLQPTIIVERRHLQGWTDDDFTIGHQITTGAHTGWTVSGILVSGGKFDSAAGGNRPTFVSGGVHVDMSRALYGELLQQGNRAGIQSANGIFEGSPHTTSAAATGSGVPVPHGINLNSARVVPTGPEFSPRTISVIDWRLVQKN